MSVDRLPDDEPLRYVSAETLSQDDFEDPFTHQTGETVWDAKTIYGSWATMTQKSFDRFAHMSVRQNGAGLGRGQKYVRQANGHLHKVEG